VEQVSDFYLPVAKHLRLRLAAKATAKAPLLPLGCVPGVVFGAISLCTTSIPQKEAENQMKTG